MPSKYEKLDALIVAEIGRGPCCASTWIWRNPGVAAELERVGGAAWKIAQLKQSRLQALKKRGVIEHVGAWRVKRA